MAAVLKQGQQAWRPAPLKLRDGMSFSKSLPNVEPDATRFQLNI